MRRKRGRRKKYREKESEQKKMMSVYVPQPQEAGTTTRKSVCIYQWIQGMCNVPYKCTLNNIYFCEH